MMSGVSSELGVSGTKMERHTPDNRPSSEEERGRAKNMANIGDSTRWQKGRSSLVNVSIDPGRLLFSESILSPESDWAWKEHLPGHCSSP